YPTSRGNDNVTSKRPYWSQRLVTNPYGLGGNYISASEALKLFWSPGKTKNYAKYWEEQNPGNHTDAHIFNQACVRTDYSANGCGAMLGNGSTPDPIAIYQPGLPTSKLMTFTMSIYMNQSGSDDYKNGMGEWSTG